MANITFTEAQLKQYIPGQSSFTWKDALYSSTANDKGLLSNQYSPEQAAHDNIIITFEKIVTPLNTANPSKIHINSVYRSPVVNEAIGGAKSSQHLVGQAVDLSAVGGYTNREIFNWLYNNVEFDQLIWEKGSPPVTGTPAPIASGNPQWVHCSFKPGGPQRKQVLQTADGKSYKAIAGLPAPNSAPVTPPSNDGDTPAGEGNPSAATQAGVNQSETGNGSSEEVEGPNFQKTFDQIARNTGNLEAGDVDVTWGKKMNPSEDSDWIGLKQFLLYLSSKFTPQSLFPFVELIPIITVDQPIDANSTNEEINKNGYVSEGDTPKDIEDNLTSTSADSKDKAKQKNKLKEQLKFISEVPPGYNKDRFATGASASNAASQTADLFSLDPFKEGINFLGEDSESGKIVKDQRNVGVRVYGQLVLNPAAIEGTPSKPGPIGFKSLEIQAGSSADNGLAMIKMTLVDVQGNKFTDINSPWAFIYDTRPGSIGGDFFFRYGWQIRVPDPRDSSDPISAKFWHHPGWEIFDDGSTSGIKTKIMEQIIPGKQVITLTQAINTGVVVEGDGSTPLALFDEGISFEEEGGTVKVSRAILAAPDNNYVRLALLNPEVTMDENGAITATLSFRTTGSVVYTLPLDYAITTRKLLTNPSPRNKLLLGDLLLALQNDADNFGFRAIQNKETRLKQSKFAQRDLRQKAQDRNFDGYVLIQGPDKGGNSGDIHPDEILISIDKKHMEMLSTSQKDTGVTLIRWFREVLQDNDCELLSAATGSGAGINSAWIITTTREQSDRLTVTPRQQPSGENVNNQTIEVFKTEKDVFSYRFQGSLVQAMTVEKTEAPNAMSIQTDFAVGDLDSFEASAADIEESFKKPVTAADRKRNLKVIFAQMQNCTIDCLCHPWIGPGKRIFVKGMGFFDGEYQVLEVTHKLEGHKFTSAITGARILLKNDGDEKADSKKTSAANGNSNFAETVTTKADTTTNPETQASPPTTTQAGTTTSGTTATESPAVAAPAPVAQVTSVEPVHDGGLLIKDSEANANAFLGALQDQRNEPDFIETFAKAPSPADMTIANAFWCEQRKGNGVDYGWLDENTRRNVQLIIDKTTEALDNELIDYTSAIDIGQGINAKYTLTINGSTQTIGS